MPPPAVRVAQPELLADRVAEGLELLRVDPQLPVVGLPVLGLPVLGLPVLGLPVLGLPHPQAVLRRNLARERGEL